MTDADKLLREMYENLCNRATSHKHKQGPRGQYTGCRICLFFWALHNRTYVIEYVEGGTHE